MSGHRQREERRVNEGVDGMDERVNGMGKIKVIRHILVAIREKPA